MIFVCKLSSKQQLQLDDEDLTQMKPQYQLTLCMVEENPQTTPYFTVTILVTSIEYDKYNLIDMNSDTGRRK